MHELLNMIEMKKVEDDIRTFGTGFYKLTADGMEHVPIQDEMMEKDNA